MNTDFHIHSTFCDGENTPEETVLYAIQNNFGAIGFTGHGYTPYDLRYCMQNTEGYICEIKRLKEKYKNDIKIYLGIEEDSYAQTDRSRFDYIIGSKHYFYVDGIYYPIDSNADYFNNCIKAFDGNHIKLAKTYYDDFVNYIKLRKPDIIGHFDLITKFEEMGVTSFLTDEKYLEISKNAVKQALTYVDVFEINTGALARGIKSVPYPHETLLYVLKKNGGKIILSSDCHKKENLCFKFDEIKKILRDIGFDCVYKICDNHFEKVLI